MLPAPPKLPSVLQTQLGDEKEEMQSIGPICLAVIGCSFRFTVDLGNNIDGKMKKRRDCMKFPTHKTKIVCTIGPASDKQRILERMIRQGMNVARLNFAHGDFESHSRSIERIRAAADKVGRRVAVMADLPGPKMRVGNLADEPVRLVRGRTITLTSEDLLGNEERIPVSFPGLSAAAHPGNVIFLNDGFIRLKVEETTENEVRCRVVVGGELRSHKGVNLPGTDLGISAITDEDRRFLEFALEQGVDVCVASWNRMAPNTMPNMAKAASNYMNSQLIKMEAIANGYVEGIGLDTQGYVSEGSGENLFLVRKGVVYTTPMAGSILMGITRETMITLLGEMGIEVRQETIPRELLYLADEVFFTGTAAEISPIRSVDKIQVGEGRRGPVTKKLQDLFFKILNAEVDKYMDWLDFV